MSSYNFDQLIDRRHTGALKVDALTERYGRPDLTPLWVADMDFLTPPFITEALKARLEHSLYGYTLTPEAYWESIRRWLWDRHQFSVERKWMSYIPGIVKGIGMVVNVFTAPDEKVIIQPPVYHPFRLTPLGNRREVVYNPLILRPDGSYDMDFDQLSRVADEKCKVLILSNPHNPAGIVWPRATLERLADFCYDRGIIVISDEIHCDMTLFGHKHTPFASVSAKAAAQSITFGAPSKTFNIAGIVSSYSIVPNPQLRRRFYGWLEANELGDPTIFAPIATMAAFSPEGEAWRKELVAYIEENVRCVERFCREQLPQVKPLRPQASFLVWLDCRGLNLSQRELNDLFVNKAHLALNDGEMFGREGIGFMRLNVGSPRSVIERSLLQLKDAVLAL
ncbi:MAG: PatB family C-S lyase [Bacteroidaceae bacterium]|nr:PatB family C-S lyase [Bacteroidaceae bacterium]